MLNYRWFRQGTLEQIEKELSAHHFSKKILPIVSQGSGWYRIGNDTWLMCITYNHYFLYYWQNCDPRPMIHFAITLKGFPK